MLRRIISDSHNSKKISSIVFCAGACSTLVRCASKQCVVNQPPLTSWFAKQNRQLDIDPVPTAPVTEPLTVSTMPNGARVISEHRGGPIISIGAYILAGPAYDNISFPGLSRFFRAAFVSSGSSLLMSSDIERKLRVGGVTMVDMEKRKHYIGFRIDTQVDQWERSGSHLIQSAIFGRLAGPKFSLGEGEVKDLEQLLRHEVQTQRISHPLDYAMEQLETVAFYKNHLGSTSHFPLCDVPQNKLDAVTNQYYQYVIPSRIVIAGVNITHRELLATYENTPVLHSESAEHHQKAIKELGRVRSVGEESTQYTGGERHEPDNRLQLLRPHGGMTYAAVGWVGFGCHPLQLKNYIASLVLRSALDFLFKKKYPRSISNISGLRSDSVRFFVRPYETAGLIGFTVEAGCSDAAKLISETAQIVKKVDTLLNDELLVLSKQKAKESFLNEHLSSTGQYCDFIGCSLPHDRKGASPLGIQEVCCVIQNTTAGQVKMVIEKMLSRPPSLFAHGDTLSLPSMSQLDI